MLLGEGAVSNAFIPVFTDVRTRLGSDAARAFGALQRALGSCCCHLAGRHGIRPPLAVAYAGGFIAAPSASSWSSS